MTSWDDLPKQIEFSPKDVQVVDKNGHNVSIPDYDSFMQFLMLASIASSTTKIRKYYDDKTPRGEIVGYVLQVTTTRQKVTITDPGQALTLTNDGPNNVTVWINKPVNAGEIVFVGETYRLNLDLHKLYRFYLQCAPLIPPPVSPTAQVRAAVLG